MKLRYAGYEHPAAECLPTFYGSFRRYNERGRAQSRVVRMSIQGEIVAVGQNAIDARVQEIINAYAVEGGSVAFLKDDGTPTAYQLNSSGSISGVKIDGPAFTMEEGKAHWATGLPFSINFEAEYFVNDGDQLVSYTETIVRIGNGGARVVWPELDNGPSQPQIVSTNTNVTIIQAGQAIGASAYPFAYTPPYLFPDNLDNPEETVTVEHPRHSGAGLVDWPISWVYRYTFNSNPGVIVPVLR